MAWEVRLENHHRHNSWVARCHLEDEGHHLGYSRMDYTRENGEKVFSITEPGVYATVERSDRRYWLYEGKGEAEEMDQKEALHYLQENTHVGEVMGELRSLVTRKKFHGALAHIDELPRDKARPLKQWLMDTIRPGVSSKLPDIEGTREQIVWAEDIRRDKILGMLVSSTLGDSYAVELFLQVAQRAPQASFWIDHRRDLSPPALMEALDLDEDTILDLEDEAKTRAFFPEKHALAREHGPAIRGQEHQENMSERQKQALEAAREEQRSQMEASARILADAHDHELELRDYTADLIIRVFEPLWRKYYPEQRTALVCLLENIEEAMEIQALHLSSIGRGRMRLSELIDPEHPVAMAFFALCHIQTGAEDQQMGGRRKYAQRSLRAIKSILAGRLAAAWKEAQEFQVGTGKREQGEARVIWRREFYENMARSNTLAEQ